MNVSLTKELENFVNELVASGMYYSASEVVRDGLRLLKEQEQIKKMRLEELRAKIRLGVEDLKAGRSQSFSSGEEVFEQIKKRRGKSAGRDKNGK
jgi:antitoxin ParD1/3/4